MRFQQPLSSDTFAKFSMHDTNRSMHEQNLLGACAWLHRVVIPEFCARIAARFIATARSATSIDWLSELHCSGINLYVAHCQRLLCECQSHSSVRSLSLSHDTRRYMGVILERLSSPTACSVNELDTACSGGSLDDEGLPIEPHLPPEQQRQQRSLVLRSLATEILARTLKNQLRELFRTQSGSSQQAYRICVVEILKLLLSVSSLRKLHELTQRYFPYDDQHASNKRHNSDGTATDTESESEKVELGEPLLRSMLESDEDCRRLLDRYVLECSNVWRARQLSTPNAHAAFSCSPASGWQHARAETTPLTTLMCYASNPRYLSFSLSRSLARESPLISFIRSST